MFCKWSNLGFSRVKHLWDQQSSSYREINEISTLTRSPEFPEMSREIFESIPWDLVSVQPDDWLTTDNTNPLTAREFYHVNNVLPFGVQVTKYRKMIDSERLVAISDDKEVVLRIHTTSARILYKNLQGKVESFNSKEPPTDLLTPWSFRDGIVKDLQIDPKEWVWRQKGSLKEEGFFSYTTKRRYRIITDRQSKQSKFDIHLSNLGYTGVQRKNFYQELWHRWVPRKVGTMIWLTYNEGLPLAEWRKTIGMRCDGFCNLCNS